VSGILQFFGNLFAPFGAVFHAVFFEPIFNVLMLLYGGVHAIAPGVPAFAIAILLLTVAIRLCLYPLTRKQLASSRAMQVLQPQLQELQRKHKGDPQALMAAQRALQKEHGVSMAGGCLPMLVQLPFLYGLYYSLFAALIPPKMANGKPFPNAAVPAHLLQQINSAIYPFLPHLATIHALPSTTFLWADLGTVDHTFILPILAGLLTFIQMRMAQPVRKPGAKKDPNTQAMSSMMYVMPFITFFFGTTFPAGLAFYWCISTGFSAVQQYFISGWGSLFVGIPGMEHLVPEPQSLPALPNRAVVASGLVPSDAASDRPTGLAGLGALLRQLTAPPPIDPQDQPAMSTAANGNGAGKTNGNGANGRANGTGRGDQPATTAMLPVSNGAADGTPGTVARRNRPERTGPTLVKPPVRTDGTNGTNGVNDTSGTPRRVAGSDKPTAAPSPNTGARPANGRGPSGSQSARRSGNRSKGGR
jgi:YidC/Oxa1 family membrane protein insertase